MTFVAFHQIFEFQLQAILERDVRVTKKKKKDFKKVSPSEVKFSCRGCNGDVCAGSDIEVIDSVHRVNVSPQFR